MKKEYVKPQILSEEFQPQTYVAACYSILCKGPNNNEASTALFVDKNGNGLFDIDADDIIAYGNGARFHGCGGHHDVKGEAKPSAPNGTLLMADGSYSPCFYWFGETLDPTETGEMAYFHYTAAEYLDEIVTSNASN